MNPTKAVFDKVFPLRLQKKKWIPANIRNAKIRLRIAYSNSPRDFRRNILVATTNRSPRDAKPLEKLGEFDPMPHNRKLTAAEGGRNVAGRDATRYEKRVEWNEDRIRWWLKEGNAQPTTRVVFLLEKAGILQPGHPYRSGKPRGPPTEAFSGNWPEFDPVTPFNAPNGRLKGTEYILPKDSPLLTADKPKRKVSWKDYLKQKAGELVEKVAP